MPTKISSTNLNANSLAILNTIRANAPLSYQDSVPEITSYEEMPAVGEIIYGTPALSNYFLGELLNRIARVVIDSSTFNNPYRNLKKGYLDFGESVEQIFVNIANAYQYTPEDAEKDEFRRSLPDVKKVMHILNWRVVYPITIQDEDLKLAFLSKEGLNNFISKLVDSVYQASEYDEFLLFKYLIIKGVNNGVIKPVNITGNITASASTFRGVSNMLTFRTNKYNYAGVSNNTPKERQVIFMSASFNAKYDVEVLAGAFNMDKADFIGKLFLIDDFTTFDNARFTAIQAKSDSLPAITATELSNMTNVQAVLCDVDWFQIYDNLNKFTEKYVASKLYWNYFYHQWKIISFSPFHNAVYFTTSAAAAVPATITLTVKSKITNDSFTIFDLEYAPMAQNLTFVQDEDSTKASVAVQPYGSVTMPNTLTGGTKIVISVDGTEYTATTSLTPTTAVGGTIVIKTTSEPDTQNLKAKSTK